ncbi:hypothetical protein F5Y00DRAFT_10740 [Daldinia vernicosa]|uniref:uncharacterized protein n=1 Tax=Daldinia vernicosa TaxID=114800 RepID=UPI002007BA41|nr:uncharacterized protein F5Y00DRAFT_10740 [Daldinia vernicosa]KAI0851495.1 hypothetical protein F5Y00DRAFT_10740 [Daldinia vernicosa]
MALFYRPFFASISRGFQLGWDRSHITSGGVFGIVLFLFPIRGDTLADGVWDIRGYGTGEDRMHSFTSRSSSNSLRRFVQFPWRQLLGSEKRERPKVTRASESKERIICIISYASHIPLEGRAFLPRMGSLLYGVSSRGKLTFATAFVI